MKVQVIYELDMDTNNFSEEEAKLKIQSLIDNKQLSANDFLYVVSGDIRSYSYSNTKFIKSLILHRIRKAMDYDHYDIEIILNELPDLNATKLNSVVRVDRFTGLLSGHFDCIGYILKDFATYKEFENEYNDLLLNIIDKEKRYGKKEQ